MSKTKIVSSLYLKAIKSHVVAKPAPFSLGLNIPLTPAAPTFDLTKTALVETALKEQEWPALYNPIDDPSLFKQDWDWDRDDGYFPKRFPIDYEHGHH